MARNSGPRRQALYLFSTASKDPFVIGGYFVEGCKSAAAFPSVSERPFLRM
jgi:hypothetical protein